MQLYRITVSVGFLTGLKIDRHTFLSSSAGENNSLVQTFEGFRSSVVLVDSADDLLRNSPQGRHRNLLSPLSNEKRNFKQRESVALSYSGILYSIYPGCIIVIVPKQQVTVSFFVFKRWRISGDMNFKSTGGLVGILFLIKFTKFCIQEMLCSAWWKLQLVHCECPITLLLSV